MKVFASEIDRAWAAGFFDGEGSVLFRYREYPYKDTSYCYRQLQLAVAQVERQALDRLCEVVGVGKVYGPYSHKNKKHNDYFEYRASAKDDVFHIWNALGPYLSDQKKGDFEIVMALYERFFR